MLEESIKKAEEKKQDYLAWYFPGDIYLPKTIIAALDEVSAVLGDIIDCSRRQLRLAHFLVRFHAFSCAFFCPRYCASKNLLPMNKVANIKTEPMIPLVSSLIA